MWSCTSAIGDFQTSRRSLREASYSRFSPGRALKYKESLRNFLTCQRPTSPRAKRKPSKAFPKGGPDAIKDMYTVFIYNMTRTRSFAQAHLALNISAKLRAQLTRSAKTCTLNLKGAPGLPNAAIRARPHPIAISVDGDESILTHFRRWLTSLYAIAKVFSVAMLRFWVELSKTWHHVLGEERRIAKSTSETCYLLFGAQRHLAN